jgi:short subunit dehydrogenase-like uncharacterized protein
MTSAVAPAPTTELDLVLFGATGFTGRLVAEYLVKKKPSLRWALAGRSRDKLERVRDALAAADPSAKSLPIVLGESLDLASMDAMVRRTRVVCTTVGPYARYGGPLVGACAARGVHYCDLSGEPQFVRRMIDAHHERAAETGARIVPCAGFDSIPSDLGVHMLHHHLAREGKALAEAHFLLMRARGGSSGGTVASMLNVSAEAGDPAVRRLLGDPYGLNPKGAARGPDRRDQTRPRRDADTGRWTAPFIMAGINAKVVRRSNALLDFAYGKDFRYEEAIDTGRGARGLARAVGVTAVLGAALSLSLVPAGRTLLARLAPSPGDGPSQEKRERGMFCVELRAKARTGEPFHAVVAADRDPGYGATAVMLAESALCLAEDALPARGGVLTTASCMGMALVERLRRAGMTFRVA